MSFTNNTDINNEIVLCSFCGIENSKVQIMIKSELQKGIAICENCIEQCRDFIGHFRITIDEINEMNEGGQRTFSENTQ